jgi:hypothetical protein
MMANDESVALAKRDYLANTGRAILKSIPYIGEGLEQLFFGLDDERRFRRVERTLSELGEQMEQRGIPKDAVQSDGFAEMLDTVVPPLSASASEEKRQRFRDLLLNAVQIPEGDRDWESAKLAADYLSKVDAPGLAILAAVARGSAFEQTGRQATIMPTPEPQVYTKPIESTLDYVNAELDCALRYEWGVIDEWVQRLVDFGLLKAVYDENARVWIRVRLTARGELLVQWAMEDKGIITPCLRPEDGDAEFE